MPSDFQYPFLIRGFFGVLLLTPILGGLSHLVVSRRMAFFSATLGQAALTGVSIGLLLGEPLNTPYGGMFGFCLLSTLAMIYVKRRSALPSDTLIGVFLALTLGLGLCLLVVVTRQFNVHQVESILFGSLLTVTDQDLALLLGRRRAVLALLAWQYNSLRARQPEPAAGDSGGQRFRRTSNIFSRWCSTVSIVVSLKIIGALLVEALVVVPAAAARNVAKGTRGYLVWSMAVAFLAGTGGLAISTQLTVPTGAAVVLGASLCFFLTLLAGAMKRDTLTGLAAQPENRRRRGRGHRPRCSSRTRSHSAIPGRRRHAQPHRERHPARGDSRRSLHRGRRGVFQVRLADQEIRLRLMAQGHRLRAHD